MKKILPIIIGLLITSSANAQQFFGARQDYDDAFRPRFGFTMGAALSNAVPAVKSNYATGGLAGFSFGFTYNYPVTYQLSVGAEALYSQKGYEATTQSGRFSQRSQFLDIPVFAKFKTGHRVSLFAGPQFSYMLTANNSYNEGFNEGARQYYQYNGVRAFFAGVVGAGFDVNSTVNVNVRYAIDFKGTNANGNVYVPEYRNQALQLAFGFKF
ncbi:porin family protein [Mucilaginibacter auburnensis]|uniref:Outer membrane protein with beta-barrel domain n=1 Tax=Mucilaginibacter auburnensis TaxID=1457233 RepID=A0A2H9VT76_9SPHI|nr:porin family protein [Mucilaginibacter auburnensis]PJJ84020.1 outer membrane protein with beta-barrel domain [Mucilaginibacter auburnensis]